jgi:hypothetical protein
MAAGLGQELATRVWPGQVRRLQAVGGGFRTYAKLSALDLRPPYQARSESSRSNLSACGEMAGRPERLRKQPPDFKASGSSVGSKFTAGAP